VSQNHAGRTEEEQKKNNRPLGMKGKRPDAASLGRESSRLLTTNVRQGK
jgi:hypothetical protein